MFFVFVFRFWQKKLQLISYVPKPNDYFKPLYHNYGGNFKVRESKTSIAHLGLCVCNFQIVPAGVAQEGTFITSGLSLMGLSLHFSFKVAHDVNESVCRGFKRLLVFHLAQMMWVDICVWQPSIFHPTGKYPMVLLFQVFYVSCQSKNSMLSFDMGTEWKICGLHYFSVWNIYCWCYRITFSITLFYVSLMQILFILREGLICLHF